MARGSLRIYLGASPGVGKTFAMLDEGRRRAERGADVVIGVVETHGRARTAAQIGELEVVPRRTIEHRGTTLSEMDIDAVLRRRPAIVLVDEFAHTNAPGSRHEKRWQDVQEVLDAGIDVISTLNIQHLESLNDVVAKITGVVQRETVPDAVVRRADQIELVDMSPEALRRRMAHGNIYPAERIDAALSNFFRPGNLGALRELALLWVADRVEESLTAYLADHGIADAWETRERVVVGISGAPGGEVLIRRAARIAGRVGGDLVGVHVVADDGLSRQDDAAIAAQRTLVESLGGRTHEVVGHDRAATLVAFAKSEKATQLVIGATHRDRWYEYWHGSLVGRVTRLARDVDVHVIGHGEQQRSSDVEREGRTRRARAVIDIRRKVLAWAITLAGLPALTAAVNTLAHRIELSTELLLFLSVVLVVAALGGRLVAAVAAVFASLLVNWWFVEPKHTFTIAEGENLVALVVFVAVALTVGALVDLSARRSLEARRARAEAGALARSARRAWPPTPIPCRRCSTSCVARSGSTGCASSACRPTACPTWWPRAVSSIGWRCRSTSVPTTRVAPAGSSSPGVPSRRTIVVWWASSATNWPSPWTPRCSRARQLTLPRSARSMRCALRCCGRCRTTCALRSPRSRPWCRACSTPTAEWTDAQLHEALVAVDDETDRLNRLVGNLLDASRLQIGALAIDLHPCAVASVVTAALSSLGSDAERVTVDLPADLPEVLVDAPLLERSLANVVSNALRYSQGDGTVRVLAGVADDSVHLSVVDRGPGIAAGEREKVMAPFQRLGDTNTADGVGLGLSIARGFLDAMHGSLRLEDTPGGGLTATLVLPLADAIEAIGAEDMDIDPTAEVSA